MVGRVVVNDLRPQASQPWSRVTLIWHDPAGQSIRQETGYDGVFALPNLEPGEYTLARLMLVRHTMVRGFQTAETLSLALPLPWVVRATPGAALVAGELVVEIRADRTVGVSVAPLSRSARALVAERVAGTAWAERGGGLQESLADLAEPALDLKDAAPAAGGPDHVVLPYRGSGRSIVVEATVNGRRRGRFLLDTGASVTVISRRLARDAEALAPTGTPRITLHTANGAVQAALTTLASLQVGGMEARQVMAAVHDLPGVGEIDGLLGMSFLRHFRMTLDPERRTLTLERR